jgi:predicted nucleic acid-binding protein
MAENADGHDAVIARCAVKAQAQQLYTCNTKHFVRLGDMVAALVRQP